MSLTYIASQENINNLEKKRKVNISQPDLITENSNNKIAMIFLNYNFQGNKSSNTYPSMLATYYLVTIKNLVRKYDYYYYGSLYKP